MIDSNGPGNAAAVSNVTRRKALTLIGATSVALASGTTISHAQTAPVEAEVSHAFSSVSAMAKATGLRAGMVVRTWGFHQPADGGGALYVIDAPKESEKANGADIIAVSQNLYARLAEANAVNYAMFGAVSDGKNDDGVQIKLAHEYASRNNLPVINLNGEYWITESNNIPITTNVQWGKSTFHIDEKYNSKSIPRFKVTGAVKQDIVFDAETKARFLAQLKPGVSVIPELAPYTNCLIQIQDTNDRLGFRAGERYKGQSWAREELFYVEELGRVIGDIAWSFKDYTTLNAVPCEDHYLIIEGGGFYLSGDNPGEKYTGYYHCGISVQRSRTIIRNQWMGLEKGKHDISMEPRRGFYVLSHVYDVTLENIRLIPWEQNREGTDRDVGAGTYGLGGGRMLNCTFRNVTAEGSSVHWGVFGTNLNKNFRIEQCQLNRVDVHFHCWNLYIRDSVIGLRGISVTGGGNLWIENTVRLGNQFLNFRRDFGAVWNGDVHIKNCRLLPSGKGVVSVLYHNAANFDYGYPLGSERTVKIEDLMIDYSAAPDSTDDCWMSYLVPFAKTKEGTRLFFPYDVVFRNIKVTGRKQGVRLLKIQQPFHYNLAREGGYDGARLQPNATMVFDNIQLDKLPAAALDAVDQVHFQLGDGSGTAFDDNKALYPKVLFSNCENICAYLRSGIADVSFERCSIDRLAASDAKPFKGSLAFDNCVFAPNATENISPFLALDAELGTSFTNSTLHAPRVAGKPRPELVDLIGFIQLNKTVQHYHLNTRLGNDILQYCKSKNITLKPQFIQMLKAHHALESETVE